MKFKIDTRYIAIQSLKAIGGYIIGVIIVLSLLDLKDPIDFVGTSLCAGIILYFLYFFPRNIFVKSGIVSFVERNHVERTIVKLSDITQTECISKLYNTLTIVTQGGKKYKLHPKDAQDLENVINSLR